MGEAETALKEEEGGGERENHQMEKSRKEKRKQMKKMKRKQVRKEAAEKEREAEEARLNDPEEQMRIQREEEEERKRREIALKEFEERERVWIEAMEMKRKAQEEEEKEEEEKRKDLKEDANGEQEEMSDDWEYIEGSPQIIWEGNEITVRKKQVRVPKKDANQKSKEEDADRPTSNPLPPQSEAFADYLNASSAQQVLESVAKEVPNFGTEQDKAHCPFHLKTGACRFGQRCSRVHFYPDKSCTLLMRNMYNGPGLAWEQDEGLEYTDEEVERCYEEFYEDVHTEFLKFGEIVNFKVCKNGAFHLRGNVYVHYKMLESAVLAYHSINGRYFAGKQVKCEFVNLTRWKVAICGEFMKSRLKTCSHGTACNFIHCFRNPGGDYEWADWDKPPPRYWVKKMGALFGYSDEAGFEKQIEQEHSGQSRNRSRVIKSDADRHRSRRSKSREMNRLIGGADRSPCIEDDVEESSHSQRGKNNDRKQTKGLDGRSYRESKSLKWDQNREKNHDTSSDGGYSDSKRGKKIDRKRAKTLDGRSDRQRSLTWDQNSEEIHDTSSDGGYSDSKRGKKNDRKQAKTLDGRSDRQRGLKWDENSEKIHTTSSDGGYSDSKRGKENDRKQAKVLDGGRSDRQRSLTWDQNSEEIHDTSSYGGYSDSKRGKKNDRKQAKTLDGRSDRQRSLKCDENSEKIHDTSSDGSYSDSKRGKKNDRKRAKTLDGRSGRQRSLKWDENSEQIHYTSSDGGYSHSKRGKKNERKKAKLLDGRSDRHRSLKWDQNRERTLDTSSDEGYSERDIDAARDADEVTHHCHAKEHSKHQSESLEYLADNRSFKNRDYEDTENSPAQTKKRTRHRSSKGG
ncbi:Zinc finger C-x8-C-x5-C-x3-H type family protein isoform 3 [Theobroma cacao]|uniref:Zinc finger C-x8-C-x5-C-x3-H type family protein isoform 3 n=1 Tax=Theobroma cacao TaxID=3641 RepID=A0A061G844_THECC|nr:Zinc finger C-x8-C-x5-C-x3-H type family protein isoform 3 [Theobroma cacao]